MEQRLFRCRSTAPFRIGHRRAPMTFLNPLVLLGLAAAAIPLIIHLFNFRRPKRVDFSSLSFLREVQKSTMQRVRIKQWLLLLLRTLAIAALVLAFARPRIQSGLSVLGGAAMSARMAIVIDDTPSTERRDASGSYFDQALSVARAVTSASDARDEVFVLTQQVRVPNDSEPLPGGAASLQAVNAVKPGPGTGTLAGALLQAVRLVEGGTLPNREIYLLSDLQTSTLVDSLDLPLVSDASIRLVPVGSQAEPNVAITDVRIVSRIVEANQPVRVEADLANHGPVAMNGYSAGLYLDDERVAQANADLPAGGAATLTFTLTPRERGWLSARVETEDDAFPADNRYFFSMNVPEVRRLLLVAGEGANTVFLATALSEALTGDRMGLEVVRIAERSLPSTDLAQFDVVVLSGPRDISSGEADRIARFVKAGGGLLWFPAAEPVLSDYNALMVQLGAGRVSAVEGGDTGSGQLAIDSVERFDLDHALFEGMLSAAGGQPEQPVLFRRMPYRPGAGTEATVITLAGGNPFLQEIRSGNGVVLFMASAADPSWTDLPTRGLFLPLLYRSVFLLSSTDAVSGERFVIGSSGDIVIPGMDENASVLVRLPSGDEVAPDRRGIVGGLLLHVDGLLGEAGIYDVVIGQQTVRRFAVNPDPREANLARTDPDEAAAILSEIAGTTVEVLELDARDVVTAGERIAAERSGIELWNVFLVVALLFLLAEMAVSRHWRPEAAS